MAAPPGPGDPASGGEEDAWDEHAYFLALGQEIADAEAREIARCVEAALPTVPDQVVPMQGREFGRQNTLGLIQRAVHGEALEGTEVQGAIEILSGPPKEDARTLIAFLKEGAFAIHPAGGGG